MTSVEDKCRSKLAKMFNRLPDSGLLPNTNNGRGYISGRPDDEIVLSGGRILFIEAKGDSGSAYLGDPNQPTQTECKKLGKSYDATGWHTHQRNWWKDFAKPLKSDYYIALLVSPERDATRIDYKEAGMFLVPPEAWLALEEKLAGRKTVALNPSLERILANKTVTLESEWGLYRLDYENGQYRIPEYHPLHSILIH